MQVKLNPPEGILLYGLGNPGKQDDGLGIEFIERIEMWVNENAPTKKIHFETSYQLMPEDALTLADHRIVIFVDASMFAIEAFSYHPIFPKKESNFSTHSTTPSGLLQICLSLLGTIPKAYLLEIKGYSWELQEGLSEDAEKNLCKAILFLQNKLDCVDN